MQNITYDTRNEMGSKNKVKLKRIPADRGKCSRARGFCVQDFVREEMREQRVSRKESESLEKSREVCRK